MSAQPPLCFAQRADGLTPQPPTCTAQRIAVHPLAIMCMSDHWTRSLSVPRPVEGGTIGVLLGQMLDGKLSIITSFELLVDRMCESDVSIMEDKAKEHLERLQEVHAGLDVVGWYAFGDRLKDDVHSALHFRLADLFQNEAMILLLMDATTTGRGARPALPVYAFECRNKGNHEFVQVVFAVEAEELETIGINAAIQAEQQASSDPDAAMASTASRLSDATSVLRECVRVIMKYLSAVETGSVEVDVELLRRIGTLCNRLPLPSSLGNAAQKDTTSQLSVAQSREELNSLMALYLGALGSLHAASTNLAADTQVCAPDTGRFGFRR